MRVAPQLSFTRPLLTVHGSRRARPSQAVSVSGERILYLDASELEKVPIVAPDRGDSMLSHQGYEVRIRYVVASYRRPAGHVSIGIPESVHLPAGAHMGTRDEVIHVGHRLGCR